MFLLCMVCHGEAGPAETRQPRLTAFYLMISAGGALGGVFVSLIAPLLFNDFYEWPLVLGCGFLLSMGMLAWPRWKTAADSGSPGLLKAQARCRWAGGLGRAGGDRRQSVGNPAGRHDAQLLRRGHRLRSRSRQARVARFRLLQRQHHARGTIRRPGKAQAPLHLLHARDRHRPHPRLSARGPRQHPRGNGRAGDRHAGRLFPAGR